MIESSLVYRASPAEQYDGLSFLVFVTTLALLSAPWWLAVAWLAGVWMLTRER